ncbi:hemerythrin domain-containing protein [Streptomyces goshikiensis]|uniref:hemerythrin domain-containing protein n=1 Tax=Streptomyces goshikiensis TaxID=1942 RepID=UPI00331FA97B
MIPVVELQHTDEAESPEDGVAGMLTRVHGWLRAQIAELLRLARRSGCIRMQPRQHCAPFCQALEAHHTGEDAGLFPWPAERHPQLAGFLRRIERTRTRIAGLTRSGVDRAAVRAESEARSRQLLAHLNREEAEPAV